MKSFCNYKTFYTGTPKKLEECPIIYFYKKENLDFDLSLKTLDKLKKKLSKESELIFCVRGDDDLFTKSLEGLEKFSFDLIIYCSSSLNFGSKNNSIIGYTIFSEPQKAYTISGKTFGRLIISFSFNKIESDNTELIIDILNTFRINQVEFDLSGEEGYNFPRITDDFPEPTTSYLRFTNKISDLKTDSSLISLTDSGVVYDRGENYSRLYISNGIPLDFNNNFLGVYKNDLVVCGYNVDTGGYSVFSLTKTNKFKKPYEYLSGVIDLSTVSGCDLKFYANQYLVFWDSEKNNYIIHFLEDNTYSILSGYNKETGENNYIYIDSRDIYGRSEYVLGSDLIKEIKNSCITPVKKLSGKYTIDLDDSNYTYLQKIGCWWEMLRSGNVYYYLSPYGCISSTLRLTIINDRLFKTAYGVFFPIEFGHTYKCVDDNLPLDQITQENVGVKISSSELWENLDRTQECLLDGLRRKPVRSKKCFPSNIIGSLYGIIFYIENGKLYCY